MSHIYNYRLDTSVQLDLPHSMPRMSTSSTMLRVKVHCSITSTSGWAAMPVTLWCTQPMTTVRCWPSVCLEDLWCIERYDIIWCLNGISLKCTIHIATVISLLKIFFISYKKEENFLRNFFSLVILYTANIWCALIWTKILFTWKFLTQNFCEQN